MKHKLCLLNYKTIALTISLLVYVTTAHSQSREIIELAPFIVSGETYVFGAQKVVSIQSDDLEKRLAMDLADIFSQDPSVKVGGGFGPAQKMYIRGIEDKLLHVSIDGATQAGYLSHHHGQYSIEPELLKFVEAEPGAGAATTGPGALAGTIKFQTKAANDFLKENQDFGFFTKSTYTDNADAWKVTAAGYGRINGNLEFLAAHTYGESGDYEDGNGDIVEYTGSDNARTFFRMDGSFEGLHSVGFSFEDTYQKGLFRHRPNFSGYFDHPVAPNVPVYMNIGRQTTIVDYGFTPTDINFEGSAKLYVSEFEIDRPSQYEMGYKSLGLDLDGKSTFQNHNLVYGIDFRDDEASFTGKGAAQGFAGSLVYQTIPDETIDIFGVYIQDSWQVNELIQLSFGARFDQYDYTDKDAKNYMDSGVSPNIGLSYQLTDDLDVNLSYGSAFRGVTPIDLITANEGSITNADEIDGETSENIELGFQYDNGTFFANGTLYQQKIDDVIVSNGIRNNSGMLEVNGYDLALGVRYGSLSSSLGVSVSDPEFNDAPLIDTENGLGVGSGRTWNANVDYIFEPAHLSVGWTLNFVESYDESDEILAHKPSYAVHDFYLRWLTGKDGNIVLAVAISNAFDKYYVDQATSGYNSRLGRVAGLAEAGRNIKLSASYQF